MKYKFCAIVMIVLGSLAGSAQVASHAPTVIKPPATSAPAPSSLQVTGKAVAKVNGAVLTDRDLLREMFSMFPYAQQHNGFPKDMEPQLRAGALQMVIFEELVYQEAKRRKVTVTPERIARAEVELRKQFPNDELYQQFLKAEVNGSRPALREKIRRSLLIEAVLKSDISTKAVVTPAQAKFFYDKNPDRFKRPETIQIQSISIIPPNETPDVLKEVRRRADEAIKQAKTAKSYREFGLLAEKLSDDDFRVKMGDHKPVEKDKLPPEVVKIALALKPGQVSDLIQLGSAFTIIRLEAHKLAGEVPFNEIKSTLQSDLQKEKVEQLRSALGKKLRANAKIELL